MGFRIVERFVVEAPADAVWSYLVDPRRVVTCLPGAELSEVVDARTFNGAVKVKVGPAVVAYKGRVRLSELDADARRVKMLGEGRESTGAGSARMAMESVMTTLPGGETEVAVTADVDVAGRAVQLGRGLMEQVSAQLFRQFAACVRSTIEAETRASAASAGGPPVAPATATPPVPALARGQEPVRAIPLLLRALWAALGAFLRRLMGGGEKR